MTRTQDAGEGVSKEQLPKPTPNTKLHPPGPSQETARPGLPCFGGHGVGRGLELPRGRDQHGLWSHFPNKGGGWGGESFQQHLLSSFSYLIKALVSLSAPDRFLAILALLLGYSRAPALAIVSFP